MERRVLPTRTVLLEARRSLRTAREGHDLLDRKRQALIAEAMETLQRASGAEPRLAQAFDVAYDAFERARISMGVEGVEWAALSTAKETRVDIVERSIMGVPVPTVAARLPEFHLAYSLGDTTASIDRATQSFRDLFGLIVRAVELETAIWRLAREIRRTQRRVNALKNVLIPRYEAIVAQVESALEEREREDLYRAKAVKRMHQREESPG